MTDQVGSLGRTSRAAGRPAKENDVSEVDIRP